MVNIVDGFGNICYFPDAQNVFASHTKAVCPADSFMMAVILTIEGITRHVQNQTNKHFILSHVSHPPPLAPSPLLGSQTVEKGWLFTCCLNLIKNSPFSQKSFSF